MVKLNSAKSYTLPQLSAAKHTEFDNELIDSKYYNGIDPTLDYNGNQNMVDNKFNNKKDSLVNNGSFAKQIEIPVEKEIIAKQKNFKTLLKGIALAILSSFCFSVTTVIVKYLKNVDSGMMALSRYIGIFILSFPLAFESGQPLFSVSGTRMWLVLRGLAGGTSVFCRFSALKHISMADSTIIILSMPVFVFVLARIFLKERFGRFHVVALCMSIVGIMFASKIEDIVAKSFYPSDDDPKNQTILNSTVVPDNDTDDDSFITKLFYNDQFLGTLFSMGSTVVGSFVYIIIRKIPQVNKTVILFNFSIVASIEMAVIEAIFYRNEINLPTEGFTPYLVMLVGIGSFYAQLFITRAIQIEEAGVVSVVRTSGEAFFAFVFQIILFKQMPDLFSIIGAALVLSSVFLLSFHKFIANLPDDNPTKKRYKFFSK